MTVFCPICAHTLLANVRGRLKRLATECDCGVVWELSTWPELPGVRAAEAVMHQIPSSLRPSCR